MSYLVALNELKAYLRIPVSETGLDAALTPFLASVTANWESQTGRTAAYGTYVKEAYQPGYSRDLALRNYPVDSNATLTVWRIDQYGQVSISDPQDYIIDFNNGIITLISALRFANRPDATQISYSAGFPEFDSGNPQVAAPADMRLGCPADLNQSCLDWVVAGYRGQLGALSTDDVAKIKKEAERNWKLDRRIW